MEGAISGCTVMKTQLIIAIASNNRGQYFWFQQEIPVKQEDASKEYMQRVIHKKSMKKLANGKNTKDSFNNNYSKNI